MAQTLGGVVAQLAEQFGEFGARGGVGGEDAVLFLEGVEVSSTGTSTSKMPARHGGAVAAGDGGPQGGERVAEVALVGGDLALALRDAALRVERTPAGGRR